jgi:hypothetical protein
LERPAVLLDLGLVALRAPFFSGAFLGAVPRFRKGMLVNSCLGQDAIYDWYGDKTYHGHESDRTRQRFDVKAEAVRYNESE